MTTKAITSKFDSIEHFIDITNIICNQRIKQFQEILEVNAKVLDIFDKRKHSKRIALSEYMTLSKYGCPDAFFDYGLLSGEQDYYDSQLDNCVNTTCDYCWKNYLDKAIDSINENPNLLIKNLTIKGKKGDD